VNSVRLKSSFIYLANAVNDLRGNWSVLAVVLAPLLIAAALCLLPDALNLQYRLATTFEPGSQNISYTQVDSAADTPSKAPPLQEPQPFSPWVTTALHVIFGLLTLLVTLVTLCSLMRIQAGIREPSIVGEAIEVYRRSIALAPGFIWVTILQLLAPALGLFMFQMASTYVPNSIGVWAYIALVLMIMLGAIVYAWLYFAQYALISDGKHSWHALLFSRDLMRKRFFKVAIRIVVFLAVWSGFTSWAAGAFVVVSLLFGPVGVVTGFLGTTIFLVDLAEIGVNFATTAFLVAAGLRLYQDLRERQVESVRIDPVQAAMQPTAQLPQVAL
jgi:MFS family permease